MAIQFNFHIGTTGHIFLMAGHSGTAMGLAHTIQEDASFRHLPTYLLAKELAKQLAANGLITSDEVDWSFKPTKLFQVGFSTDKFEEVFGKLPEESIAAFDLNSNPIPSS